MTNIEQIEGDVVSVDNQQCLNELHLFAGAGGGILASELLGHRTVCAVEINKYAREVLVARQNDGTFPPFPIWDDVCTFDGTEWRGIVDIVSGGFPCQDISVAGKGAGLSGERSGLWTEFARIISEVRPRYAFIENSPMLTTRGLDTVLCDLAAMGYDAEWGVLSASDVGAPHLRERIWILGYSNHNGQTTTEITGGVTSGGDDSATRQIKTGQPAGSGEQYAELADIIALPYPGSKRLEGEQQRRPASRTTDRPSYGSHSGWWQTEPDLPRVVDGLANRSHRLTCIGNGQVPLCAATAFNLLKQRTDSYVSTESKP